MAKKPRKPGTKPVARPKAKPDDGKVRASDVMPMPSQKFVRDLVRDCDERARSAAEINGESGKQIAEATQKNHVDKKALSFARQLNKMSDRKLAITLPHLRHYIDALKLDERAERHGEMFPEAVEEDAEEAAEDVAEEEQEDVRPGFLREQTEAKTGDVVSIGDAARKVAETAGGGTQH